MAVNETVGINLVADTKSLRSQLKEAVAELANLQNKAGASAKEIATAAKRAAELKDRIGDAKATIEAFNPDAKFKAFGQSIAGVAGAFSAAQGALALFGVESENVQKQLLKVQAALALSEGLNSIMGSIDGFKNLALVIKTQVLSAFSTLRGAIIATGIGALAIGLGLVIANFEAVKEVIYKAIPGFKGLVDTVGSLVEKFTDFVGITSQAERSVDKLAKQTKNRNAELENEIKLLEAGGSTSDKINKKKIEQIENEKKLINEKAKLNGKYTDEELQRLQDLNTNKAIIIAQDNVAKQKQEKTHQDELNKIKQQAEEEYASHMHGKYVEYERADKELYDNRIQEAHNAKSILEKIAEQTAKNQEIRMEKLGKKIENAGTKEVKVAEATSKQKIALAGDVFGILSGMAEQGTDLQKGLALAQIAIDTGIAISGLTASTSAPSADNLATGGLSGFAKYAVGIIKILANIAQAKNIIQSASSSGSGGATSAPSIDTSAPVIPQIQMPVPTQLNSTSLNAIQNVVSRAYVVESDISNSQNRIQRIQNAARF